MNLSETPILYDPRETPYAFTNTALPGPATKNPLVRVSAPTFYPYRDGVRETRVTASSLYPAEGIGDEGEVVVHNDVLEPLERAREQVREAGFELAVVSGFSGPTRAQEKFVKLSTRLIEMFKEQKKRAPTAAEEIRIYRLASSVGTAAPLSSAHPKKTKAIQREIRYENFAGLIETGNDVLNLAAELHGYRGNMRTYRDEYTDSICPPIIYTAVGDENYGRTLQCVLTSKDEPERALNMGIGVDIPYPSLQAPNAFEDMPLSRLKILVGDNPLAREYFTECAEPPNEQTIQNISNRRRVLYHSLTNEGFVHGNRQGMFTLPVNPIDLPPRHYMLSQGQQFGHKW